MRRLCAKMARAPRALLVAGQSAAIYSFDSRWDALAEKYVAICRGLNIPTVIGTDFFETLSKYGTDKWHFSRDVDQDHKMAEYYINCTEALVAGFPTASVSSMVNRVHSSVMNAIQGAGGYHNRLGGDYKSVLGFWTGVTQLEEESSRTGVTQIVAGHEKGTPEVVDLTNEELKKRNDKKAAEEDDKSPESSDSDTAIPSQ